MKKAFCIIMMLATVWTATWSATVPAQDETGKLTIAFNNLVDQLTREDYIVASNTNKYSNGLFKEYDFTVPKDKSKCIESFNSTLTAAGKEAYSSMMKKAGASDSKHVGVAYGEKNEQSYTFGTHKEHNYNLQYLRDAKDSTYRYVYALVWEQKSNIVTGKCFLFYGKDPKQEQKKLVYIYSGDTGDMDSIVVNNKIIKYQKGLTYIRGQQEVETVPKSGADFLQQFNNLRIAFKNAKTSYNWSINSDKENRRTLQTGIANKIVKLCQYKQLLTRQEKAFCSNTLMKMKKDTDDDYLQDLLGLTATTICQ